MNKNTLVLTILSSFALLSCTEESTGTPEDNPGEVPPVLAELESMDVTDVNAMRGHKVFFGNDKRNFFLESLVEEEYINLDFRCDGEGIIEFLPAPQFQDFADFTTGTFTWKRAFASETDGDLEILVTDLTSGTTDHGYLNETVEVEPIVNGSLIKGTAVLESLVLARIVQYDTCE